ncbi:MAG: glycosyltransferase family 4 protein [Candidatus Hodarchaeota archaeon]
MRICIIGDCTGNLDEGMKNTTFNLFHELSKKNEVQLLNPRNVFSKDFWKSLKHFNPTITHYIMGPSILSFTIVKCIGVYCKNTKTIMSITHPQFLVSNKLISLLKPDLTLVHSTDREIMFRKLGFKTKFVPNGVDVNKFRPVSHEIKMKYRDRYGIEKDKFIILHVGNIRKGRNIKVFKKIQQENNQVIIIGSTSVKVEKDVYKDLINSGCLVWVKYFKNINEIYALSDCYVFPVVNRVRCIESPLSVMEAMACNLPVITTRFGMLPRLFNKKNGVTFVKNEHDIIDEVRKIKNSNIKINTREIVSLYSWGNICNNLEKVYVNLLEQA